MSPHVVVAVLRLVWFDPSDTASGTESVARAEAAALLTRMGATVAWRRCTSPEVIQSDEVWVTLLGAGPASASHVLGASSARQPVASVVWIRVPNVRAAVGLSGSGSVMALTPVDRRVLAVALGRVNAHEVVHARVPSLPHGSGLMSRSFTRRQLTGGLIPFEPEVAFALQAALRGDPVIVASGTRVLATGVQLPEKDRWDR